MLFEGGFSFSNFLADVLAIFVFVVWFWLLITVFSDLFRRHDISGWAKALWCDSSDLISVHRHIRIHNRAGKRHDGANQSASGTGAG
jgi:hypothetical protein